MNQKTVVKTESLIFVIALFIFVMTGCAMKGTQSTKTSTKTGGESSFRPHPRLFHSTGRKIYIFSPVYLTGINSIFRFYQSVNIILSFAKLPPLVALNFSRRSSVVRFFFS